MNFASFTGGNTWDISCRKATQWLGAVLAVVLLSVPAFAQGNLGRIMGAVTDTSGGAVSGATVTVVDVDRGINRTLTTDDAGEYNAPNLTPGNYTVRVEASGFKKIERTSVEVGVGKEVRVDVTVQPGEVGQTVTVTESVPLVETSNATLGGTLDNADIVDMPLNGRNYQNLLALRPGVMIQPGGGPWSQSTNGIRPDYSVWMVDGVLNMNFYDARPIAGMSSPTTDAATILPIDSIQEFNTMENPKAEYGWNPGAVVNVGIKSGTNQIHGSLYGFYRSAAWDARNYFNPAPVNGTCVNSPGAPVVCNQLPTQLKQYGGSIGGPIKKDKLFFFANYEGLNDLIGNALVGGNIPTTVAQSTPNPGTSTVDAINALVADGIPVSPVSLRLMGCSVGVTPSATACSGSAFFPNNPAQAQNGTLFTSTLPNSNNSRNGVGKIDYHINDKNTLNGLLMISDYAAVGEDHPFITSSFLDDFNIRTYTNTENWIYTPNSSLVNEMRFGYVRLDYVITSNDASLTDPIATGLSIGGLPDINIGNFTQIGTWHNRPQNLSPNPVWDYQDAVSYLKGKHSYKFGYEFSHIEADSDTPNYGRGRVIFDGGEAFANSTPLEDFFAGAPTKGTVLIGNPSRAMTWTSNALFAQDDWRITPRVTINLGMRWQYQSPIKANDDGWANFDPASASGIIQQGQPGASSLWNPNYHDFSPRLGFAWDVTGQGTTVVRGGFSIMYSTFTTVMWMNQNNFQNDASVTLASNPSGAFIQTGGCSVTGTVTCPTAGGNIIVGSGSPKANALCWDPTTPYCAANQTTLFSQLPLACGDGKTVGGVQDAGPCDLMGVDPNLKTPYVMNYNLGIQHQFGNNYSLEVGYVGNRGERLTGFTDLNQPNVATSVQPYATQFPWLNYIDYMSNDVHSNYNSLQVTMTKRMSHGLSFVAGYTYAHGLDDGSLNRSGLLPQDSSDVAAEYASSDFDVRNRFTFTTTYNIPGKKGYAQMLEGWQVNAIVTLQSAQPWVVNDFTDNFDPKGIGDTSFRWNFAGDPANFRSSQTTIPYCSMGSSGPVCTQTSAVYGTSTAFSAAQSAVMWDQCLTADPLSATDNMQPQTTPGGNPNSKNLGCYVSGNAVMTPPNTGTYGDMGRNIFRDSGFKNVDFSVFKNFTWRERFNAQFRLEVFNLLNHPIIANPYGASNGFNGANDPSNPLLFGGSNSTPDGAAGNPLIGSGAARDVQIGLKVTF